LSKPVRIATHSALCSLALAGIVGVDRLVVHINATTTALAMLLIVLGAAARWGFAESIFTSLAGTAVFNFFFLPPVGTFTIADPQNWVALIAFLVTAITTSQLSAGVRQEAADARARRADINCLYELSRALLMIDSTDPIRDAVTRTGQVLATPRIAFYETSTGIVYGDSNSVGFTPDDLRRVAERGEPLRADDQIALPVQLGSKVIGSLALNKQDLPDEVRDSAATLLAISYERSQALQRASAAEAASRGAQFRASLIDGLAHDLKTPLSAIRTCITRLVDIPPRSEEVRQELLSIIDQESERLHKSLTQTIELARVESGALKLALRATHLEELLPPEATVDAPPGLIVNVDPSSMRRAIEQLLENARKYSPTKSDVRIEAREEDGKIRIAVLDRGPGIAPEERDRIFEKFYRGRDWQGKAEGTGMGLAIARGIIEAHGGRIRAEARPGGGTAMVITLPSAR
jgi:two-component system, OmpR family, sensor histidine kinase KdpD